MIVPVLLVAMVALLLLHGVVLPRRISRRDARGVVAVAGGSHAQAVVPSPGSHGFDAKHWTSVYGS